MNLKKYKSVISIVAVVGLLAAAAFCGYHIYYHYAQVDEQTEAFEELAEIVDNVFFVKHFSLKKASEFPVFTKGFSLLLAGIDQASLRMRACSIR